MRQDKRNSFGTADHCCDSLLCGLWMLVCSCMQVHYEIVIFEGGLKQL